MNNLVENVGDIVIERIGTGLNTEYVFKNVKHHLGKGLQEENEHKTKAFVQGRDESDEHFACYMFRKDENGKVIYPSGRERLGLL